MHHARVKQALRAADHDGFARGHTAGWWRGFYHGLVAAGTLGAATAAAFLLVSRLGLGA